MLRGDEANVAESSCDNRPGVPGSAATLQPEGVVERSRHGERNAPPAPSAGRQQVPSETRTDGAEMMTLIRSLYPICRSITGDGVRETLARLSKLCPIAVTEVPSGTPAFDWTVPPEWTVRSATLRKAGGETVVDFARHTLHLVSYSTPVRQRMTLAELQPHLHSLPEQPDLIPYRTAYYAPAWGFCLPQRVRDNLADGDYDVDIDTSLAPGHLTYGECVLPGQTDREILISAHICHPSLANDNLSSLAVAAFLARRLAARARRHTVRILFAPGTIGALTWLAQNEGGLSRIRAGLVLSCLGDRHPFQYKRSERGDTPIDRAMALVLAERDPEATIRDFLPYGYDERQFNAPGFRLPVGNLCRSSWGEFPEYHTSADTPDLLDADALQGALDLLDRVVQVIDADETYVNLAPKGEPQLGRRGLYSAIGGAENPKDFQLAVLWVLNQADGTKSLIEIADRARLPLDLMVAAAEALKAADLIAPAGQRGAEQGG